MPRFRHILITACAAAAALPTAADAAVSCDFDAAQKRLDVTLTAAGNHAPIQRDGSTIRVGGKACPDGNVAAGVTNTDRVVVKDTSDGATDVAIVTWTGAFAPGATARAAGASEIEFEVNGGNGSTASRSSAGTRTTRGGSARCRAGAA